TANEAALRLFLSAYMPRCDGFNETVDGYGSMFMARPSSCGLMPMPLNYYVRVNRDASLLITTSGQTTPCVGRRPQGLLAQRQHCADALGMYFAEVAHLEAAAVLAFDVMSRELESLHAPAQLLSAARNARADEIRHAAQFAALARAHGVEPRAPQAGPASSRGVLEIALENAAEGVVRETWGALSAAWQALHASDVDARSVFQATAADEAQHAQLSRDLDSWLHSQLTAEEQRQVAHAKADAFTQLRAELAASQPHPSVAAAAGVPNRARSLDLLTRLEQEMLQC
ncbi:MAG TPA: hypothetical protein VMF89_06080, partial [Polyangiales bacterium]|nr:hypothetical protein [Polyangiales bacterium]